MTLRQLRQSYFEIKEPVFGKNRAGMAFNSDEWERWLKEKFGDLKMCDVTYPRSVQYSNNTLTVYNYSWCIRS